MSDDEDAEYGLVMPFVACQSNGGEYQDHDWVCGYEMGLIAGQLAGNVTFTPENPGPGAVTDWRWINKGNVDQLDLIAMQHGHSVEFGEPFESLVAVRLKPIGEAS